MHAPRRSPLAAAGWMLAAVASFSLMDAGMKLLSAHYPPLQVTLLRGAASLPFVLVWVLASAGVRSIVPVRWGLHLLRGVLGMVMIGCFVYALRRMPLSTAYTLYFVAPLLVAALSVPLLGEKVGPRRWTAIGIGLLGVVVVLRPGVDGLVSFPGLMVLLAATAYAIAAVTVSLLTRTDTPQSMVVWFLAIMAVGAGLAAIPGWVPLRCCGRPCPMRPPGPERRSSSPAACTCCAANAWLVPPGRRRWTSPESGCQGRPGRRWALACACPWLAHGVRRTHGLAQPGATAGPASGGPA